MLFTTYYIYSFLLLAYAECNDSFLFSEASSIPLCYIPFPSTLFHQLVFYPPTLHLANYFLVDLTALLLPYYMYYYVFKVTNSAEQQSPFYRTKGYLFIY